VVCDVLTFFPEIWYRTALATLLEASNLPDTVTLPLSAAKTIVWAPLALVEALNLQPHRKTRNTAIMILQSHNELHDAAHSNGIIQGTSAAATNRNRNLAALASNQPYFLTPDS